MEGACESLRSLGFEEKTFEDGYNNFLSILHLILVPENGLDRLDTASLAGHFNDDHSKLVKFLTGF